MVNNGEVRVIVEPLAVVVDLSRLDVDIRVSTEARLKERLTEWCSRIRFADYVGKLNILVPLRVNASDIHEEVKRILASPPAPAL